ncbi:MAG: CoB--CoM heterodisulfide reductase iron-sulfur subunit B family protein [Candidatus Bathyarchaeota archaeon]|nr:CoB--CoM heterodisulfide reductase iron-sulfur subunit B family protein [Candidatus Bathyarchaeota archaeon]
MTEYLLYPGCVASVRELGYEMAMRAVFKRLDVKLRQRDDFNCCMPACLVHSVDYKRGLALTSRNLAIAEEEDLPLMTLCSSCFGNLSRAKYLLDSNQDLRRDVNKLLGEVGREYRGKARVEHVVTSIYKDYGPDGVREMSVKPLSGVRAAPFYGCHLFLPQRYSGFDDAEFPQKLDRLIEATGAESVDYHEKTSCCIGCGSFFGDVSEEAGLKLAEIILDDVKASGADAIVATCPFCMMQLEVGQIKLREAKGKEYGIPVIHYVDAFGLSLGVEPSELGLDLRRISVSPLLQKLGRD